MIFVVHDTQEDPMKYIASYTTREAAEAAVLEMEEDDRIDGDYIENRYRIRKTGFCWALESGRCGYCINCICMLDTPETDCPEKIIKPRFVDPEEAAGQLKQPTK